MEAVAERVAQRDPEVAVSCAYLEMMLPDLPSASLALMARGATSIRVVPMFLGIGKHLREDLPKLMEALREAHPEIDFTLDIAVGEQPAVVELLAEIASRPQVDR